MPRFRAFRILIASGAPAALSGLLALAGQLAHKPLLVVCRGGEIAECSLTPLKPLLGSSLTLYKLSLPSA